MQTLWLSNKKGSTVNLLKEVEFKNLEQSRCWSYMKKKIIFGRMKSGSKFRKQLKTLVFKEDYQTIPFTKLVFQGLNVD